MEKNEASYQKENLSLVMAAPAGGTADTATTSISNQYNDNILLLLNLLGTDDEANALRQAYLTAYQTNRGLVLNETPLENFLRAEEGDLNLALRRLCMYWKCRLDIFGPTRWLKPMLQTSNGALSDSAIDLVRSGVFSFVHAADAAPLVIFDSSKSSRPIEQDALEWGVYYTTLLSNEQAAMAKQKLRNGVASTNSQVWNGERFRVIHKVSPGHRISFLRDLFFLLRDAMPVKMEPVRIVLPTDHVDDDPSSPLCAYLREQALTMIQHNSAARTVWIPGSSEIDRIAALQAEGISPSSLPRSLGGHLPEDFFEQYIRARIPVEDLWSAAPPTVNANLRLLMAAQAFPPQSDPSRVHHHHRLFHQQQQQPSLLDSIASSSGTTPYNYNNNNNNQNAYRCSSPISGDNIVNVGNATHLSILSNGNFAAAAASPTTTSLINNQQYGGANSNSLIALNHFNQQQQQIPTNPMEALAKGSKQFYGNTEDESGETAVQAKAPPIAECNLKFPPRCSEVNDNKQTKSKENSRKGSAKTTVAAKVGHNTKVDGNKSKKSKAVKGEVDKKEMHRLRNAEYQRRFKERENQHMAELEVQVQQMEEERSALQSTNQQLNQALQQAQVIVAWCQSTSSSSPAGTGPPMLTGSIGSPAAWPS